MTLAEIAASALRSILRPLPVSGSVRSRQTDKVGQASAEIGIAIVGDRIRRASRAIPKIPPGHKATLWVRRESGTWQRVSPSTRALRIDAIGVTVKRVRRRVRREPDRVAELVAESFVDSLEWIEIERDVRRDEDEPTRGSAVIEVEPVLATPLEGTTDMEDTLARAIAANKPPEYFVILKVRLESDDGIQWTSLASFESDPDLIAAVVVDGLEQLRNHPSKNIAQIVEDEGEITAVGVTATEG